MGFATQNVDSPHLEKLPLLSGIIAMSPLIHLTKPAPKPTRIIGGLLSKIVPNLLFPTQMDSKVSSLPDCQRDSYPPWHRLLVGIPKSKKSMSKILWSGRRELYAVWMTC